MERIRLVLSAIPKKTLVTPPMNGNNNYLLTNQNAFNSPAKNKFFSDTDTFGNSPSLYTVNPPSNPSVSQYVDNSQQQLNMQRQNLLNQGIFTASTVNSVNINPAMNTMEEVTTQNSGTPQFKQLNTPETFTATTQNNNWSIYTAAPLTNGSSGVQNSPALGNLQLGDNNNLMNTGNQQQIASNTANQNNNWTVYSSPQPAAAEPPQNSMFNGFGDAGSGHKPSSSFSQPDYFSNSNQNGMFSGLQNQSEVNPNLNIGFSTPQVSSQPYVPDMQRANSVPERKPPAFNPVSPQGIAQTSLTRRMNEQGALVFPQGAPDALMNDNSLEALQNSNVVFSGYLLKQNRHGKFQKRLFRFDGFLFLCLSPKRQKLPDHINLLQFDPARFKDTEMANEFVRALGEFYPGDPPTPALTNPLIAAHSEKEHSANGANPDIYTKFYHLPKWIVPTSEMESVRAIVPQPPQDPESLDARTFLIRTQKRDYVLRAPNGAEFRRWTFLLTRMSKHNQLQTVPRNTIPRLNDDDFPQMPPDNFEDDTERVKFFESRGQQVQNPSQLQQLQQQRRMNNPSGSGGMLSSSMSAKRMSAWQQSVEQLLDSDPGARKSIVAIGAPAGYGHKKMGSQSSGSPVRKMSANGGGLGAPMRKPSENGSFGTPRQFNHIQQVESGSSPQLFNSPQRGMMQQQQQQQQQQMMINVMGGEQQQQPQPGNPDFLGYSFKESNFMSDFQNGMKMQNQEFGQSFQNGFFDQSNSQQGAQAVNPAQQQPQQSESSWAKQDNQSGDRRNVPSLDIGGGLKAPLPPKSQPALDGKKPQNNRLSVNNYNGNPNRRSTIQGFRMSRMSMISEAGMAIPKADYQPVQPAIESGAHVDLLHACRGIIRALLRLQGFDGDDVELPLEIILSGQDTPNANTPGRTKQPSQLFFKTLAVKSIPYFFRYIRDYIDNHVAELENTLKAEVNMDAKGQLHEQITVLRMRAAELSQADDEWMAAVVRVVETRGDVPAVERAVKKNIAGLTSSAKISRTVMNAVVGVRLLFV